MARSVDPMVQESSDAVESWIALKQDILTHNRAAGPARQHVGSILRFLGLPVDSVVQLENQGRGQDNRWIHFTLKADPKVIDGVKGAPLFGSQSRGVFHIFCLWEDARPDRMRQNREIRRLAQHGENTVIVLYLNALTDPERQDIRRDSWESGIVLAILDELLLEYLARTNGGTPSLVGGRLGDFLAATLPYTASNPYNPETTGWGARVPPEMFYGREELARSIMMLRDGTSIVFGGRQLGKTALLRKAEEAFSHPEDKHFAWFIDLKDIGFVSTTSGGVARESSDVLKIIHEHFCSEGILTALGSDGSLDQARQEILAAFRNDQQLQVIVMFDESDAFLELDSIAGLAAVESMRALMNATSGRFKVVFAGLHNVQRFANRPNNPFPNLGFNPNRPRRGGIGPLNDHAARQLVEQPCGLLGFRFEPLVVDRILSYTNRHPSLLQFFCHELIKSWRDAHRDALPPFVVRTDDVDRVYRSNSIQEGIRRRFEETFKLDPRYHVIALTMIYCQERPTQKWSLDEIRSNCQYCCPFTFDIDNMEDLELRSLLTELVGLGILAEDSDSYRMRSSLIPQMFGSTTEIERMLEELEGSEPFGPLITQLVL